MILMPEQIEQSIEWPGEHYLDLADTLAAYAEIVQKVALNDPATNEGTGGDWYACPYCEHENRYGPLYPELGKRSYQVLKEHNHALDCPYLAARKLRGLE